MRRRPCLLLVLLTLPACVADDHEPPVALVPGDEAPGPGDWEPDPRSPALEHAGPALPSRDSRAGLGRDPIDHADPRPLPDLAALRLQAAIENTEQELQAGLDDMRHAELLMRHAELSLVRDAEGDRARALADLHALADARYADFRRRDDVLFYLAFEARRDGDAPAFRQATLELVRAHPNSRWVPEAYAAFGDLYVSQGEPDLARQFYERVVAGFPRAPVAVYAAYRWAWAELSLDDPTRSLERFVRTIELGDAMADPEARRITEAARRDLPIAYARVGRPERAWGFLQRLGRGADERDHTPQMAGELVRQYRELGRPEAAATVCRDLVRHAGHSAEC